MHTHRIDKYKDGLSFHKKIFKIYEIRKESLKLLKNFNTIVIIKIRIFMKDTKNDKKQIPTKRRC